MPTNRLNRIDEEVKRALADIIRNDVKDDRLSAMTSVTKVDVTQDLKFAKVYVSVYDTDKKRQASVDALNHGASFIRTRLARAVAVSYTHLDVYKRQHFGTDQNARVEIDGDTGEIKVFAIKNVVDEIEDEETEITVEQAREINEKYEAGDVVETEVTPRDFGRIAAQTAKQVVVQRIREAERGIIYDQYSEKENEVLTAIVHRIERGNIYVELGRAEGIIPVSETVYSEQYNINDRIKVYVLEVKKTNKGPQIIVSVSYTHLDVYKRQL